MILYFIEARVFIVKIYLLEVLNEVLTKLCLYMMGQMMTENTDHSRWLKDISSHEGTKLKKNVDSIPRQNF